jgi:hypothetical protein
MQQDIFRAEEYTMADQASADARASFITKTYVHLFGAILAFIGVEALILSLPITESLVSSVLGIRYGMLLVLAGFMGVSYVANRWAASDTSVAMQYAGLGLYVVAEAVFFAPLLYIAANFGGREVIPTAAILTGCAFTGITSIVFFTRKNFSFIGPFLGMLGLVALGLIVCSMVFSFSLGIVFSGAMAVFAGATVLYTTSNVLHEYRVGQHVAASLALFASVALLFWYILQILMSMSRN